MSKENKILLLVGLVLVFSWLSWSNTKQLQNQVRSLQNELHNVRTQVSSEVSGISRTVQSVRDDARWWNPGQIEFSDIDEGKAEVKIDWHLKEYWENSEVALNYRISGEENYVEVTAEEKANGYFAASIPVEVSMEPLWHVNTSRVAQRSQSNTTASEQAIRNEYAKEYAYRYDSGISYYITVKKDDMIRSSEERSISLHSLRNQLFGVLETDVRYDENAANITVLMHEITSGPDAPVYKVEEVLLQSRSGGSVVEQWILERDDERNRAVLHRIVAEPSQVHQAMYLVVKYNSGLVIEREIPTL